MMGMPPHYMQVIRGGLVLLALVFDSAKTSLRRLGGVIHDSRLRNTSDLHGVYAYVTENQHQEDHGRA
jgi:hypothetical protein